MPVVVTLPLQVFLGIVIVFYYKQPQLLHILLITKLCKKGELYSIAAVNDHISQKMKNLEFKNTTQE